MKIKISGASGYIGNQISAELIKNGHEVFSINRDLLYGDSENLSKAISNADAIINLAGSPILKRWTKKNRTLIYNSRIQTTTNLIKAINKLPEKDRPGKFISASAIGIYKSGINHDETSMNFNTDFVGKVTFDWEASLYDLPDSIQKNIFRIGLVLGKNAKTIKNLIFPFKLGLGATIGKGEQAFPFIHEKDVCNAFIWAVEKHNKNGTFNLVAPENISNKEFTKAFAKTLHRPAILRIPAFALKLTLGKAAVLLLESPSVAPNNLSNAGFEFSYPTIESSLSEILT